MKKLLQILSLTFLTVTTAFASFPIANDKSTKDEVIHYRDKAKSDIGKEKSSERVQLDDHSNSRKNIYDLDARQTAAIILGFISVLIFPFALHNWYLGRTKQALWQSLMVFPGFILLFIPLIISWIWQVIDLVKIITGELE